MFLVVIGIVRVDENVVEVYDYGDVEEVGEDVVHEMLKSCQSVCKSERHN